MAVLFGTEWSTRSLFRGAAWRRRWENPMERMNWSDICQNEAYVGRWVALDACRYDAGSGRATEGAVVDVDDDLVELMNRIRESDFHGCEILFCAADGGQEPPSGAPDSFPH